MKAAIIIMLVLSALTGCTAGRAIIAERARDAGTAAVDTNIFSLCALPYSALVRMKAKHPNLGDAIPDLCGKLY